MSNKKVLSYIMSGILVLVSGCGSSENSDQQSQRKVNPALLDQINSLRSNGFGCPDNSWHTATKSLLPNEKLNTLAHNKAQKLANQDSLMGTPEDQSYEDRLFNIDYIAQSSHEWIISTKNTDTNLALASFINQPSVCLSLLDKDLQDIGFGQAKGRSGTVYWVIDLASQ